VSAKNNENHVVLNFIRADYQYLPTLEIKLKEGRNFLEQFKSDAEAIIINKTAVMQLGHDQDADCLL
jgi:putative ABC transport system permease protein